MQVRLHSFRHTDWASVKQTYLKQDEIPKRGSGTIVAIDAEFVALQQVHCHLTIVMQSWSDVLSPQEETEYRSDGTKKVLRPSQLTLARVSVLRGGGSLSGTPFIDDYIHTTDAIVDYLTEYSGINCEYAVCHFDH